MLDIIVKHVICICIAHKSCVILHFYTLCHIKKNMWNFSFSLFFYFILFYFILFCYLVRNENVKILCLYTLQVTRVSSNFPQLKQLNKIKNACAPSNKGFLEFSTANTTKQNKECV